MPKTPQSPALTDDALAELLADALVERAMTDPYVRRVALRAAGLLKEPVDCSIDELARQMGVCRKRLKQLSDRALQKLSRKPEVYHIRGYFFAKRTTDGTDED